MSFYVNKHLLAIKCKDQHISFADTTLVKYPILIHSMENDHLENPVEWEIVRIHEIYKYFVFQEIFPEIRFILNM